MESKTNLRCIECKKEMHTEYRAVGSQNHIVIDAECRGCNIEYSMEVIKNGGRV